MKSSDGGFWKSGSLPLIEPEFLGSIISAASDIALVVSSDGQILSVLINSNEDGYGSLTHWEGRKVVHFLTSESVEKFNAAHEAYLKGTETVSALELNHSDNATWQYPVRYTFHRFGNENAVLMLGRDLRQVAETQQQLVKAQIALEQGYEARREFDARYRVLLGHVQDAVVFVQVSTGRVDDANPAAATLLGLKLEALQGANFAACFSDRSGAELTETLITATLAEDASPIPVTASRNGQSLLIRPVLFRASGARILMCRLTTASAQHAPVSDEPYGAALFEEGSDAMLFAEADGAILAANHTFIDLVGAPHRGSIVGQNLAQFLARGQIDLGLMLGNGTASSLPKIYTTRLLDRLGAKIPVEISLTRITGADRPAFGLVIRDVTRLEPVRHSEEDREGLPSSSQKVVELVGSATLKEIVAETTDVVEKMCIETAVSLTRNNRVAAAEMLGLSRQSLYVKLRKYGLLSRD